MESNNSNNILKRPNDDDIKSEETGNKKIKVEDSNNKELYKMIMDNKKQIEENYKSCANAYIDLQKLAFQIKPQPVNVKIENIKHNINGGIVNSNQHIKLDIVNNNPNNIKFIVNGKIYDINKSVIERFPNSNLYKKVKENEQKNINIIHITRNPNNFDLLIRWMSGNLPIRLLPLEELEFSYDIIHYGFVEYIFGNERIFAIGGQNGDTTLDSIECYYPKIDKWIQFAQIPQGLRRTGCVMNNGILYIIGGYNGQQQQKNMVCYDIKNRKWYNGVPMQTMRTALSVVLAHGLIFAIGGFHNKDVMGIVEIFHIGMQKWLSYQHSLNCVRLGHSSCYEPKTDKIYVIGGWDSTKHFNSCEVLDLKKPSEGFKMISEMNNPRSELTSVCLDGKIYAIGGYDGINFQSSVEVYDPKTNKWSYVAPMMFERGWPAANVSNGKIYVSGGRTQPGKMLNTIEVYDPATNIWSVCSNMQIARDGHQMISLIAA